MNAQEGINQIQLFINDYCDGNVRKAAKILNENPQSLWNWIKGKRKNPRADGLTRVLDKIAEISGDPQKTLHVYKVPILGVSGAGIPDSEVYTDEEVEFVTVPHDLYREGCFAVRVQSDSMEPTIEMGSICGILPTHNFAEGGIFLVSIPYLGQVLKRFILKGGIPALKSDNPRYEDIIIEEEYRTPDLIRGRVIWNLHKM